MEGLIILIAFPFFGFVVPILIMVFLAKLARVVLKGGFRILSEVTDEVYDENKKRKNENEKNI